MLSVQTFQRFGGNAEEARKEMDRVKVVLEKYFDENPAAVDEIIDEKAFVELKKQPAVVALFPSDIRDALNEHTLFSIFNVVRIINGMEASNAKIAAYMITVDDWESINEESKPAQSIGGSIVPLSDATSLFVNDAPLCSRTVNDGITMLRQEMKKLEKVHLKRMADLDDEFVVKRRQIEADLDFNLRQATGSALAWSNIIDRFSYIPRLVMQAKPSGRLEEIMRGLSFLGNAVYISSLSREIPRATDYIFSLSLGKQTLDFPRNEKDLIRSSKSNDVLSIFGPDANTFHNVVGRRWLLHSMNSEELEAESAEYDRKISTLRSAIFLNVQLSQSDKSMIDNHMQTIFPQSLIYTTIGGDPSTPENIAVARPLHSITIGYFTLGLETKKTLSVIESWMQKRISFVVSRKKRERFADSQEKVNAYNDNVDFLKLAGKLFHVDAYKKFLDDPTWFEKSVVYVVRYFYTKYLRARPREWKFLTPFTLNQKLKDARYSEANAIMQMSFKSFCAKISASLSSRLARLMRMAVLSSFVLDVCTRAYSFMKLAELYVDTIDVLLQDDVRVDLFAVNAKNPILLTILPQDDITRVAFSALGKFVTLDAVSFEDGLLFYFSCMYLYRRYKNENVSVLDSANSFYPFLLNLQDLDASKRSDISNAFVGITPPRVWNVSDFKTAVLVLTHSPDPPFSLRQVDSLQIIARDIVSKNAPPFSYDTFSREVKNNSSFAVITFQPDQINLTAIARQILFMLDILLGGTVLSNGDIPFKKTCLQNNRHGTFFSVYMACLIVYVRSTEVDLIYQATSALDLWMTLHAHFDSYKSSRMLLSEAILETYEPEKTSEEPRPAFSIAQEQLMLNVVKQYIIPNVSSVTKLESAVLGLYALYPETKKIIWESCPPEILNIARGWLDVNYLQHMCGMSSEFEFGPWIEAKRFMFLLTDEDIAASIYSAASIFNDSSPTSQQLSSIYSQKSTAWNSVKELHAKMYNSVIDYLVLPANDASALDTAISEAIKRPEQFEVSNFQSARDYNELIYVYRYHAARHSKIIFDIASVTMLDTACSSMVDGLLSSAVSYGKSSIRTQIQDPLVSEEGLRAAFPSFLGAQVGELSSIFSDLLGDASVSFDDLFCVLAASILLSESELNIAGFADGSALSLNTLSRGVVVIALSLLREHIQDKSTVVDYVVRLSSALLGSDEATKTAFKRESYAFFNLLEELLFTTTESAEIPDHILADVAHSYLFKISAEIGEQDIFSKPGGNGHGKIYNLLSELYRTIIFTGDIAAQRFITEYVDTAVRLLNEKRYDEYNTSIVSKNFSFFKEMCQQDVLKAAFLDNWTTEAFNILNSVKTLLIYSKNTALTFIGTFREHFRRAAASNISPFMIFESLLGQNGSMLAHVCEVLISAQEKANPTLDISEFTTTERSILALSTELNISLRYSKRDIFAFKSPQLVGILYLLETILAASAITVTPGLKNLAANALRTATANQTADAIRSALVKMKDSSELRLFANFSAEMKTLGEIVNNTPRYGSIQIAWAAFIEQLIVELKNVEVDIELATKWDNAILEANKTESQSIDLRTTAETVVLDHLANRASVVWDSIIASTSIDGAYEHVFVANNYLLCDVGPHRHLAVAIASEK